MKFVKVKWRGREIDALLINQYSDLVELKLKNGYNIILDISEIDIINEQEIEEKKPEIVQENGEYTVIMTGGTIMSKVDYSTGAVYPSYDLSEIIPISSRKRFLDEIKFSEGIGPRDWEKIANMVYEELKDGQKVIVLHGTDTLTYTSSAIGFSISNLNHPVVFVGSQRSSDRPSSDQYINIKSSFKIANSDIGESIIVMHDTIQDTSIGVFRAVRTRKSHTSRRDAFKAIGSGKIGRYYVLEDRLEIFEDYKKTGELGEFKGKFSEKVAMLYFYPGMEGWIIEEFSRRYLGIVIIGTGLGHIDPNLIKYINKDKVFVMTSQTIEGRVNMYVYRTGRDLIEAGVRGNMTDMLPEVAYVKLSWLFGNNLSIDLYEKNLIGEITKRSVYSSGA